MASKDEKRNSFHFEIESNEDGKKMLRKEFPIYHSLSFFQKKSQRFR